MFTSAPSEQIFSTQACPNAVASPIRVQRKLTGVAGGSRLLADLAAADQELVELHRVPRGCFTRRLECGISAIPVKWHRSECPRSSTNEPDLRGKTKMRFFLG